MKQVIYINSRPFVLRDVEQPFSNLEYTVCNNPNILLTLFYVLKFPFLSKMHKDNHHVDVSKTLENYIYEAL